MKNLKEFVNYLIENNIEFKFLPASIAVQLNNYNRKEIPEKFSEFIGTHSHNNISNIYFF